MNETDFELLKLAASAEGIEFGVIHNEPRRRTDAGWTPWNPLISDGDAFRLAVKLNLRVHFCHVLNRAIVREHFLSPRVWIEYGKDHSDPLAATRRAIVRAAAYIGRSTT